MIKVFILVAIISYQIRHINCAEGGVPPSFHVSDKSSLNKKKTSNNSIESLSDVCLRTNQLSIKEDEENNSSFYALKSADLINFNTRPNTSISIHDLTERKMLVLEGNKNLTSNDVDSILLLKNLETLYLKNCNLKAGMLRNISNLENLVNLKIDKNEKLSAEDYQSISNLKKLEKLSSGFNKMNSIFIEYITNINSLEGIDLYQSTGLTTQDLDLIFNKLNKLAYLSVYGIKIKKGYNISNIEKMAELKTLCFKSCAPITTENLRYILNLVNLERLNLIDCQLQEKSLIGIEKLVNLKHLSLSRNKNLVIDDLRSVFKLKNLETLFLYDMDLKKNSLLDLHKLTKLQSLNIRNYPVISEYEITMISKMTNLKTLALTDSKIKLESIRVLTSLNRLEELWIGGNNFGPSIFDYVLDFENLKYLSIDYCGIKRTDEIKNKLKICKEHGIEVKL